MTDRATQTNRIVFYSQGQTAIINADGSGLRYFEFDVPDQETWSPGEFFPDGKMLLTSMEARRDGPGESFDEYFHLTPTHTWIYNPGRDVLEQELLTKERMTVSPRPYLLLKDGRALVQVIFEDRSAQSYNMNLDGTDAREVTQAGEGLAYGHSLSPDGSRIAYHHVTPSGYQILTSDVEGGNRVLVATDKEYLYFGPKWSPDGEWLVYQGCLFKQDSGHDWSDLFISRTDGSEQRQLTDGQALWFGASYGSPETKGGWLQHAGVDTGRSDSGVAPAARFQGRLGAPAAASGHGPLQPRF